MNELSPPKSPLLSPEALRIFLVGGAIFLALLGTDVALELTGHGGSDVASIVTKALAAIVGAGVTFLAGRAPGPEQAALETRLAVAERRANSL